jgi:peptidoglycan-associated lipoprotein
MPFRTLNRLAGAAAVLALLVSAWGCTHKRPPALANAQPGEGGSEASGADRRAPAEPISEGPDVRGLESDRTTGADLGGGLAGEGGPLADIHFEYDSAVLTDAARGTLEKHALWLQGHREAQVTVEGHCDERGTVEYNLALGEQRARATREYLVGLGVAAPRLRVVSYGKERPLDTGNDDAAHAKNRRAHFAVR